MKISGIIKDSRTRIVRRRKTVGCEIRTSQDSSMAVRLEMNSFGGLFDSHYFDFYLCSSHTSDCPLEYDRNGWKHFEHIFPYFRNFSLFCRNHFHRYHKKMLL